MNAAVWIAATATFMAAVVVGQLRQTETGTAIEHRLLDRPSTMAYEEVVVAYVRESVGLDDAALRTLARTYAVAHSPDILHRIGVHLTRDRQNMEAGRPGVFLLEAGAELYRSPLLLERAGWQFYGGHFVERDFGKATYFLSDPRIRYRVTSIYRLGRVLFDKRNPNRNEATGLALINEAAVKGHRGAMDWLARTMNSED